MYAIRSYYATTKAHEGHDEDISREEILAQGLVGEADYTNLVV